MAFSEDMSVFFSDDDFAIPATYTRKGFPHPYAGSQLIYGIFDNKYVETEDIQGRRPMFSCAEDDLPNITDGDQMTINDIKYTIKDWDADGTGEITILLRRNDS